MAKAPTPQKAAIESLAVAALDVLKTMAEATGANTLFWNRVSIAAFMCNCGRPEAAVEVYKGLQNDIVTLGLGVFDQLPKEGDRT